MKIHFKDKLKQTLDEVRAKCSVDLSNIPIIIADVKNQHSLNDMAAQCKVRVLRSFLLFYNFQIDLKNYLQKKWFVYF